VGQWSNRENAKRAKTRNNANSMLRELSVARPCRAGATGRSRRIGGGGCGCENVRVANARRGSGPGSAVVGQPAVGEGQGMQRLRSLERASQAFQACLVTALRLQTRSGWPGSPRFAPAALNRYSACRSGAQHCRRSWMFARKHRPVDHSLLPNDQPAVLHEPLAALRQVLHHPLAPALERV